MADAPQTITAEKLCALTGLSDRRHRQLAKEGYFPPPVDSVYQLAPTITGMFRHYRELGQRRSGTQAELKEEKTKHEIALLKAKLDREEKRVYDADEVHRVFMHIGTDIKGEITRLMESELPPKLDGLPAVQMRPILRDATVTILNRVAGTVERFYATQ